MPDSGISKKPLFGLKKENEKDKMIKIDIIREDHKNEGNNPIDLKLQFHRCV